LILNAVIVGGFLSLLLLWVSQMLRRVLQPRNEAEQAPNSGNTTVAFGSVPPPAQ
jgi:hypothetical protein